LVRAQFIVMGGVGYGAEALSLASELKPNVVLVGVEEPSARALQTIESLVDLLPDSPIIAYSSLTDAESARKAVVAGVRDYLTKPLNTNEVVKSVQTAIAQQERRRSLLAGDNVASPKTAGMIITIFGAKGGIGKTTTAINLASAFVAINAGSAVVVDVDTVFGDAAMMMDVPVETSLVDAADKIEELDRETISSYLSRHSSGVKILPAPFEPTDWRNVSPEAVDKVFTLLSQTHDFVIADCPATFTDLVAVALEKATVVLLLTSLDITSIKDTTTALKLLNSGMDNVDKIKLVINRATNVNSVGEEDVSKVLRREVFWSIPHDPEISASLQLGTPVVIDRPLSAVSETIRELAAMLAGVEVSNSGNGRGAEPVASGILTRLFKR
ncbi:MAG: AAA family ATPase, partial [Dehalococcoidia bacterium]